MPNEKRKFKVPHSYVILVMFMILVSILTFIIPAGAYDRVKNDLGFSLVVGDSFHYVESSPVSPLRIPALIVKALVSQADIIFPLLVIGGAMQIILATKMFHAYCRKMTTTFAGKEKYFIPVLMLVFAIIGITQSTNKLIGFALLGVMIANSLGYDAVVGVSIVLLGAAVGFCTGIVAPSTAVAQMMADLPVYSGMSMRTVSFVVFFIITAAYVMVYAEKVKKDPTRSVVHGAEGVTQYDVSAIDIPVDKKHPWILLTVVAGFGVIIACSILYSWDLINISACFLWMGLISGAIYGFSPSKMASHFVDGARGMLSSALVIGLGATVALILNEGHVLDTVVMGLSHAFDYVPNIIKAPVMLLMNVIINVFVTSATGQAAVVMPIMVPLADLAGISRQTAVLAFKFGDGFGNYILPHASSLMGFISAAGIGYDKWMKFMWKLFLIWMVTASVLLSIAHVIHY